MARGPIVRLTTYFGRLTVVTADGMVDVERASEGRFSSTPRAVYEDWDAFCAWADELGPSGVSIVTTDGLGPPSPEPRQIFAVALNYGDHAAEAGADLPESPNMFTKFPSAISGPNTELVLPSDHVDWEAELVAVIGRRAENVAAKEAWSYIAGVTAGQDFSERLVQMRGTMPQFSLGKSYPGFAPIGPVLVTPDEFSCPDDLLLECLINGETVQSSRTSKMIFPIPQLVEKLSDICVLLPGDLIFTGTPDGTGYARDPQRFLRSGDVVVTRIEGIGELKQVCVAGKSLGVDPHRTALSEMGVQA